MSFICLNGYVLSLCWWCQWWDCFFSFEYYFFFKLLLFPYFTTDSHWQTPTDAGIFTLFTKCLFYSAKTAVNRGEAESVPLSFSHTVGRSRSCWKYLRWGGGNRKLEQTLKLNYCWMPKNEMSQYPAFPTRLSDLQKRRVRWESRASIMCQNQGPISIKGAKISETAETS